jgi:S-adenosylmethionine uptake transporter
LLDLRRPIVQIGRPMRAATPPSPAFAYAAACLGIALYAVMDAVMKALALAMGAYPALFWRLALAAGVTGIGYAATRPSLPSPAVIRVHGARSAVVAVMALAFFWGIARVPLAVAVGLSFIAPLIALALAAMFLGEKIGARSVTGSVLALAGVGVILAGRLGGTQEGQAVAGMAAVLLSAVFYAVNLVMARHQAQLADPLEIAFFQSAMVTLILGLAAPWWLVIPTPGRWPAIALASGLAIVSLLLLSWANRRAEAQLLVTSEYTAFIWSALMGWMVFGERLTMWTLGGTVLIVIGCLAALRARPAGVEPGL